MKKLFIALPFVAGAAAVAGTSHLAGLQVKDEYHQYLTMINTETPFLLVSEEYESGISRSSAVTTMKESKAADAQVLFRFKHDIQHGPIRMSDDGVSLATVNIDTRLHDEHAVLFDLATLFKGKEPFTLKTTVAYSGEIHTHFNVNPLSVSQDGETFTWSGMTFTSDTKDLATVGEGSLGAIAFNNENTGGSMSIAEGVVDVDVLHHGGNIYTGTGDVRFDDISFISPELPVPVTLESLVVSNEADESDGSLNGRTRVDFNGIESDLPINNASVDVDVEGLKIEGLRSYGSILRSLSSNPDMSLEDAQILSDFAGALKEIFAPGSAISYALALDNDEGDVKADIRLALKDKSEIGKGTEALDKVVNGRDLLNLLALNGNLNADTAALAQTPLMMMLGGAGDFISVSDDSITSQVSLEGTTLVVNGTELPLDLMSGGMLDVPFSDLLQM